MAEFGFHWREVEELPLRERFPPATVGSEAWATLVELLPARDPFDVWDRFLAAVPPPPARLVPCVFVSHQARDVALAERIANVANDEGFCYWLDVHDPGLAAAHAHVPSSMRPLVIAAIIEIALLNSTHVLAVHTGNSRTSKWVPYELGRAKVRLPVSTQAAGWFQPGLAPLSCGEYVGLAVCTDGEHRSQPGRPSIRKWLKSEKLRAGWHLPPLPWLHGPTQPLPT